MTSLLSLTGLTAAQFAFCVAAVFLAGMVRGFSGFALSAMAMAILVSILPPIELIAVFWFLEMSASLLMVRGGFRSWDRGMVFGLTIGSITGNPVGLYLTGVLPVQSSKMIALMIILVLSALQLLKVRATVLATKPGVVVSGFTAGIASGLAGVGGMVVALYVLARDTMASSMRGSLVMYLFLTSFTSFIYLSAYGMMTEQAVARGLLWAPVCMIGVLAGQALFRPSMERYYKPFCLSLLMFLAALGLGRQLLT